MTTRRQKEILRRMNLVETVSPYWQERDNIIRLTVERGNSL